MGMSNRKRQRLEQCRVYQVVYIVYGRGDRPLTQVRACVVAMDVADLVDQIRKTCLGVEITGTTPDGQFFHEVAERVEIESSLLMGRLHGITDRAYGIVATCDAQEREDG